MKYYAFAPTRQKNHRKYIELMHPNILIIDKFAYDDFFIEYLEKGDTVIAYDIFELCPQNNGSFILDKYLKLIQENVELIFDRSPNCNSNHIMYLKSKSDFTINEILLKEIEAYSRFLYYDTNFKSSIKTRAKMDGKQIGGKEGVTYTTKKSFIIKNRILEFSKDFNGTLDDIEIINALKISRKTYYKYKKELRNNNISI